MSWLDVLSGAIEQALGPQAIIYCLAAIGLNIHFGYTGLLNFGQAAFMMVGGYAVGSLVQTWDQNLWLSIVVGLLASVVLALVLGVPTLRLRADYLAIATIAAAEAIRQVLGAASLNDQFGGQDGRFGFADSMKSLNPIPQGGANFGFVAWRSYDFFIMIVGWTLALLLCGLIYLLMRSPWGRVLKGIREDEDAVRALGENVFQYKMQALVLGGVIAAVGGIVYALPSAVSPGVYVTSLTFFVYTALLLGGAATVFGPLIGSLIFWVLQTFLSNVLPAMVAAGLLPFMSQIQASTLRFILVGIGLMLLVIFRPQGILGDKKELTFVR
jgi:branched-chain amino acid transport system permease protein